MILGSVLAQLAKTSQPLRYDFIVLGMTAEAAATGRSRPFVEAADGLTLKRHVRHEFCLDRCNVCSSTACNKLPPLVRGGTRKGHIDPARP